MIIAPSIRYVSITNHGFIDRVSDFVRKDAGRKAGDHLLDSCLKTQAQDVVVYQTVDAL